MLDLATSHLPGPAVGRPWTYVYRGGRRERGRAARAVSAATSLGLAHVVTRHGPVSSSPRPPRRAASSRTSC